LVAFQDPIIKELRIKESLSGKSDAEIEAFQLGLKEVTTKGFASIKSKQYAGLHAISSPILDVNGFAVAAITVPMLARIDGTAQTTQQEVEDKLKKSAAILSSKISLVLV
jgi:DNA-binding IclR family transcriptional regulator